MVTASVTYLRSLENNVSRTARLLELLVRVPRMFQAASEDLTSWENLHGEYWVIDPNNGCIWERGTIQDLAPDDPVSQDVVLTQSFGVGASAVSGFQTLSDVARWGLY